MPLPTPGPITIKDKLVIGNTYTIKKQKAKLLGLHPHFARFKFEDGHVESFQYWDLERWWLDPKAIMEDESDEMGGGEPKHDY